MDPTEDLRLGGGELNRSLWIASVGTAFTVVISMTAIVTLMLGPLKDEIIRLQRDYRDLENRVERHELIPGHAVMITRQETVGRDITEIKDELRRIRIKMEESGG